MEKLKFQATAWTVDTDTDLAKQRAFAESGIVDVMCVNGLT